MRAAALRLVLPLLIGALVIGGFLAADPLRGLTGAAPPVEELTVERTRLGDDGIAILLRADGSSPVELAQVQVDGAFWTFEQDPPGPIDRLGTATVRIPYPWVLGETHHLLLVTRTGVGFEHTIDVALPTPAASATTLLPLAFVGFFVGVVPVALGMLFLPALRAGGTRAMLFALALTLGLLAFLLVDTLEEALELARQSAPGLHVPVLVWLVVALSFALLLAAGRRGGHVPSGAGLAAAIALGIGLHNFGEGLAIGSALATGAAALGSFLVIGFTLHNITEGFGIVAPLARQRPALLLLAGLALLAGLPAVLGIWLGSIAHSAHWAALALAVGAGAILQVLVEVGGVVIREARAAKVPWLQTATIGGMALGMTVMAGTALLVAA
jgi:ZIP family zinc transporter